MSIYLRSVKPVEKDRNSRVVKLSISGIGATDGIQLHVLRQRPIPPIKYKLHFILFQANQSFIRNDYS